MIREAIYNVDVNEEIISKFDKDELKTIEEILEVIKKGNLYKQKVLFRGFGNTKQLFSEVTNTRSSFYGGLNDNVSKFISKYLKVKNPTFATRDIFQAGMFGDTYLFVPGEKNTLYYSQTVRDILADMGFKEKSDEDLKGWTDNYKKVPFNKLAPQHKGEVIISAKKYYLVNWRILSTDFKSKFHKPKPWNEDLTYQDVFDTLKAYLSLAKWQIKNNKGRRSFEQNQKDDERNAERRKIRVAKHRKEHGLPPLEDMK